MIHKIYILGIASISIGILGAEEPKDLLRLTNGELAGDFAGMTPGGVIRWERDDGIAAMEFKPDNIRQIILRDGTGMIPGKKTSNVALVNDDKIPGRVISMDADNVTMQTQVAGPVVIPRDTIKAISPNPFGGRLVYAGPFRENEWKLSPADEDKKSEESGDEETAEEKDSSGWYHVGAKWYNKSSDKALLMDAGMPAQSTLKVHVDWRSRPSLAIGFYSDFMDEPEKEDDGGSSSRYETVEAFGNSMVLLLRHNYAQLQRCGYDADGEPFIRQIRASSSMVRFDDTGSADIELRSDIEKGLITLYLDGVHMMQWKIDPQDLNPDVADNEEEPKRHSLGTGIGFQSQGDDSPFRVSDIYIAEWNGMPDAARSMDSEQSDVVLLTNGTDRFSGKVTTISDETLTLESKYASLSIPMDEIAEVRFATSTQRILESEEGREVRVHMQPIGSISGTPVNSTSERIQIRSPLYGEVSLDLEYASMLEFNRGGSFLNFWDDDL